ncbi:(2Fe-2S)-binding protein [Paenibacillus qinlingensis]|uniref:Ferric iron reductase protein FhuF n=1 Tax=Paenibacillus qinlingensis TaxID=1837343 RepID=A0ABU1NYK3_9BACL|nr:(2Fe-2S)-binding protein [Paenibacillus qinlingensis]MDR6552573.1 ferric iron reductase protein FhuF [Paenibacillus qinlingensis]
MPIESNVDFTLVEQYFHISPKGMEEPLLHIPARQLLDGPTMLGVLEKGQALLRGKGLDISASYLGLSLFNLVATSQLFLSQYNQWLVFDLDNIAFEVENHGDHAHIGYKIINLQWKEAPTEDRDLFIELEMRRVFAELISPVIAVIAEQAKVNQAMIWNQFAARMTFVRDYVLENDPRPNVREQFSADYEVVTKQLTPDVFGRKVNPFVHEPKYIDSPYQEGKKVIMRSSCCMYYRREEGQKCFNCPILKESEREAMFHKIRSKQESTATAG